jgi:hypothetical protein
MTEAASMNWSREFDEPIALPDGGELRTLLDAGRYVDALPRSNREGHNQRRPPPFWQGFQTQGLCWLNT